MIALWNCEESEKKVRIIEKEGVNINMYMHACDWSDALYVGEILV